MAPCITGNVWGFDGLIQSEVKIKNKKSAEDWQDLAQKILNASTKETQQGTGGQGGSDKSAGGDVADSDAVADPVSLQKTFMDKQKAANISKAKLAMVLLGESDRRRKFGFHPLWTRSEFEVTLLDFVVEDDKGKTTETKDSSEDTSTVDGPADDTSLKRQAANTALLIEHDLSDSERIQYCAQGERALEEVDRLATKERGWRVVACDEGAGFSIFSLTTHMLGVETYKVYKCEGIVPCAPSKLFGLLWDVQKYPVWNKTVASFKILATAGQSTDITYQPYQPPFPLFPSLPYFFAFSL